MKGSVLIAAGGTGGHVIPAQVVAEQLKNLGLSISFAACGLSSNPFFDRAAWPFHDIPAAPLSVRGFLPFVKKSSAGMVHSFGVLRKERPSLVIGFGSYHSLPLLAVATFLRIPFILYAGDAVPGRAVRLFAPFARWTGCFFDEAASAIRGTTKLVAHPLRPSVLRSVSKEEGRAHFGLPTDTPAVLVLGGSQGAKSLNTMMPQVFDHLRHPPLVIHLAGPHADVDGLLHAYQRRHVTAAVRAYEMQMEYAFAACDAVIARSGASAIAEIEAWEKPALYIPYPKAKDDHQTKNALLAQKRGMAIVIDEAEARPKVIADHILALCADTSQKCDYGRKWPPSFVSQIVDTLHEVPICPRKG